MSRWERTDLTERQSFIGRVKLHLNKLEDTPLTMVDISIKEIKRLLDEYLEARHNDL